MKDAIVIKGISQGILITLQPEADWEDALKLIGTTIDRQATFFKGAQVVLDVKDRRLSNPALHALSQLLDERDVRLAGILGSEEETLSSAQALELATNLADIEPPTLPQRPEDVVAAFDSEEYGTAGVLIKRTLRSGRTIRSAGHVVVIGDVNSGAEIVAVGDIIVWGKIRGIVHAGAQGDQSAVVCALDLMPVQLRIASLITVPPQEKRRRKVQPEMAFISDNGQIEAVPWTSA